MFFKPVRALRTPGRCRAVLLPAPQRARRRLNSSPAASRVPLRDPFVGAGTWFLGPLCCRGSSLAVPRAPRGR